LANNNTALLAWLNHWRTDPYLRKDFRYIIDKKSWLLWDAQVGCYKYYDELFVYKLVTDYFLGNDITISDRIKKLCVTTIKEQYGTLFELWNRPTIRSVSNGYLFIYIRLSKKYEFFTNEEVYSWDADEMPLCNYSLDGNLLWNESDFHNPLYESLRKRYPRQLLRMEMYFLCIFFGYMKNEIAMFIVGRSSAGKSTIINFFKKLIRPWCTFDDIINLGTNQFSGANMKDKRVQLCSESQIGQWTSLLVKIFKLIVGRDEDVMIEEKNINKDSINFEDFFFLNGTNQFSTLPPKSDYAAIYRRLDVEEWNLDIEREDETFKDRLLEERDGVFTELVKIGLEYPEFYKNMKEGKTNKEWGLIQQPLYQKWSSAVSVAIDHLYCRVEGTETLAIEVYDAVADFLILNGYPQIGDHELKTQCTIYLSKMHCPKHGARDATRYLNLTTKNPCAVSESDISNQPANTSNWRLDIQNVLRNGGKTLSQLETELRMDLMDIKMELKGMEAEQVVYKLGGVYMLEGV
jgi:hypothetical protein